MDHHAGAEPGASTETTAASAGTAFRACGVSWAVICWSLYHLFLLVLVAVEISAVSADYTDTPVVSPLVLPHVLAIVTAVHGFNGIHGIIPILFSTI